MEAIQHPYVNENFATLLPRAESDLTWKKIAYKVSEYAIWALATIVIAGLVITAIAFPHIIAPDIALTLTPCLTLLFARGETSKIWAANVVDPRYRAFIEGKDRRDELKSLAEKKQSLENLSPQDLKNKVASFGLNPDTASTDTSLITRYEWYADQAEKAQNEANALFVDPSNEANYYKGYRKEEMVALSNKVHAAAMLHLMKHPQETRSLKELAPITPQRFDTRTRLNGRPFDGEYLPGISREFIRFAPIREIAARVFGT
jgi:hypothetical protein